MAQIVFENANFYYNTLICIKTRAYFHTTIVDRLVHAPVNLYHDVTPIGRILSFFSDDIPCFDWYFLHCVQSVFKINALMVILTVKTMLSLPLLTPVYIYNWFVGRYLKD